MWQNGQVREIFKNIVVLCLQAVLFWDSPNLTVLFGGEFKVLGTNGGSLRGFLGIHLPYRQERLFDFKSVALAVLDVKNSTYK